MDKCMTVVMPLLDKAGDKRVLADDFNMRLSHVMGDNVKI
jgi:hypothetical protein